MKDLYTFDIDVKTAEQTYNEVVEAYHLIFQSLQVPYMMVQGDSGSIGKLLTISKYDL